MGACCHDAKLGDRSWLRRSLGALRWVVPTALLALMPKCPVCVAAYVALATGIGISLPVAAVVRTALIVLCVASLAYLIVARFLARHIIS